MLCVIWFVMGSYKNGPIRLACVKARQIPGRALLCIQGSQQDVGFRINLKAQFEMRKDHSHTTTADQLKY